MIEPAINLDSLLSEPTMPPTADEPVEAQSLADITPQQWRSGAAAWLGWMFDGLDMHLYTLVAVVFVAQLSLLDQKDPLVKERAAWIQAAFLFGWALGGGFFGWVGDRIGRSRALALTILTYALFTGLSFFAQAWWHMLLFRFLAALGIGGEWAVGASLLAETWPKRWRPWLAAVLQSAVNVGVLFATLAGRLLAEEEPRTIFLVGVLPALIVFWIRRAVPETDEWHQARDRSAELPGFLDLFRGSIRRITILSLLVCGFSLTAHWAFMFWSLQQVRELPDVVNRPEYAKNELVAGLLAVLMGSSIVGNFVAGLLALKFGFRTAIVAMCLSYFFGVGVAYRQVWSAESYRWFFVWIGISQGLFGLFTMYLPPLFPTLLRSTGAGFSYNFGRVAAAFGTVFFLLIAPVGELRFALLYAGLLFLPAACLVCLMPEHEKVPADAA